MAQLPDKFVVQTPKAVIDKGKIALIFGLVFTIPVLIFNVIWGGWETSVKVLVLGASLSGTGMLILLTHQDPRLEVYGSYLRVVGPGKRDRIFSIEEVGRAARSPNGGRVLFDRNGQILLQLSSSMDNLDLLDQYLFGKD